MVGVVDDVTVVAGLVHHVDTRTDTQLVRLCGAGGDERFVLVHHVRGIPGVGENIQDQVEAGEVSFLDAVLVSDAMVEPILSAIRHAGRFSDPGTGIALVLPVDQVAGMESQTLRKERE